jgi:flagellar hook assembly protein FlgD
LRLLQNYPNPFNPDTYIPYQLAKDSHVTIRVYGSMGQLVRTMDLGHRKAGVYVARGEAAHWDGINDSGERVANGIYYYTIQTDQYKATKKMIVAQ